MKSTKNKTWKMWIGFGLLLLLGGTACKAYPPAPASQAQVAAGAERYLYVTPATLYYMRTNGLLGGTNNFNYFYPVDATVTNTTTLPAGSNATVTVTGSSNLVFVFGIPAGRDGAVTNTVNITNTINQTNVYTGQFPSTEANPVLDLSKPEQALTDNFTFTAFTNAPDDEIVRYVGISVRGVSTVTWPQSWSPFHTNSVTLTNGVLAVKCYHNFDITNIWIAPYQP